MAIKSFLFSVGRVVATPGALAVMESEPALSPLVLLARHQTGDWGDVNRDDWGANDSALADGGRIFSVYKRRASVIWLITEADRSATTFLCPEEY